MFSVVGGAIEKMLALDSINQVYLQAASGDEAKPFAARVLETMKVGYDVSASDLGRIPAKGPVVVVANHPFGGLEGVILGQLLRTIRSDVKLMANFLLERIPDMRDDFIFVDPFAGEGAARANLRPLKETIGWLKKGGMLGVFPAGAVSHIDLKQGGVVDPPWSTTIARIIRRAEAPVVPVFFQGSNSLLFQVLGLIHPRLRTAMLPHEFLNKKNRTLEVRVGAAVPFKRIAELPDEEMMVYLRMRTYHLQHRKATPKKERKTRRIPVRVMKPDHAEVIPATDPDLLDREVRALPIERRLVESGPIDALYAYAREIPNLLLEIGRLRELTFREVEEGTGQAVDLDLFDDYYIHLFLWQRETREVIGAYRLGKTDVILDQLGKRGLYTHTLFHYRKRLLREINPALEMGRSFIRKEYQRNYSSLLLLWKGMGQFIVQNPRYKTLFGPVSMNNAYNTMSRHLLIGFLKLNNFLPEYSRLVKARKPLRGSLLKKWKLKRSKMVVRDLEDVDTLISDIESDLKGMPILMRQYLKLGGKLLGFNVDPDFSYVVDGLILVDLTKTDRKTLAKYMGKEGAESFLAHHGLGNASPT
ncbi:MAG TPA: GNAT family N-acyltransferase [Kiritimatiellia bacterium]|nr:GNAT family N-acyltransferase [Kiritimatiellia bacterium]